VLNGKRSDGSEQKKWYDTGIGTNWWDKVVDGAIGFGIDPRIQDGHRFLVENHPDPEPCHHSPRRLFA